MQVGRITECLNILRKNNDIDLSESINKNGDNLLHYACKMNDFFIVEYVLKKCPKAALCENKQGKKPQ